MDRTEVSDDGMVDNQHIASELLKVARLLVATRYGSNLDKETTYRVIRPFSAFIQIGSKPSNSSYGNARIMQPIWKKVNLKAGEELVSRYYGDSVLYVPHNGKAIEVHMEEPEFAPMEKNSHHDKFPLNKLEKVV